jgi:predicted nucleic acid-binding protein
LCNLVAQASLCTPGAQGRQTESPPYGELLYGAAKSLRRVAALERLRELVYVLPVLALPESAAEAYGSIRAELEARGGMIGNNDLWIAAHAMVAGLTLVTNNESESRRVRRLKVPELGSLANLTRCAGRYHLVAAVLTPSFQSG